MENTDVIELIRSNCLPPKNHLEELESWNDPSFEQKNNEANIEELKEDLEKRHLEIEVLK